MRPSPHALAAVSKPAAPRQCRQQTTEGRLQLAECYQWAEGHQCVFPMLHAPCLHTWFVSSLNQGFSFLSLPLRRDAGPAHASGLQLKSKRINNGLEAHITIPRKYCAFPGIINGGIVSTLMECHGNW